MVHGYRYTNISPPLFAAAWKRGLETEQGIVHRIMFHLVIVIIYRSRHEYRLYTLYISADFSIYYEIILRYLIEIIQIIVSNADIMINMIGICIVGV